MESSEGLPVGNGLIKRIVMELPQHRKREQRFIEHCSLSSEADIIVPTKTDGLAWSVSAINYLAASWLMVDIDPTVTGQRRISYPVQPGGQVTGLHPKNHI